jgi:hypothetical protein
MQKSKSRKQHGVRKKQVGKVELTEYTLIDIENAVAEGAATMQEIADALGMQVETFRNWKIGRRKNGAEESRLINEAIDRGRHRQRSVFLHKAENALQRLVCGEEYDEEHRIVQETKDGKFVTEKTITKRVLPNLGAVTFFLANTGKWVNPLSKEVAPMGETGTADQKHFLGWELSEELEPEKASE